MLHNLELFLLFSMFLLIGMEGSHSSPPSMKVSYSYIIFCCSERVTVAGLGLPNKVDR